MREEAAPAGINKQLWYILLLMHCWLLMGQESQWAPQPGWTVEVKDTTSSTTTTTTTNRAPFQRQFIIIADTLFITEPPEDSHYPARRISEHLRWSSKEWSFPLPIYRASFKGRWLVWKPGLPDPNGSLHTLQEENCKYYTLTIVSHNAERKRKKS